MDLKDKVAVITGGARGLGKAYAEAILEAGGKVSLLDVLLADGEATDNEFKAKFGPATSLFIQCDVTNTEQFENAFHQSKEYFGHLDIVINNAGILKSDHKYDNLTIDINLKALIKGTYLSLDYLRRDRGGHGGVIVNIGSNLGLEAVGNEDIVVYSATKHGVIGFTRCLAVSIGDPSTGHGVKVVCLCPGPVETVLLLEAIKDNDELERLTRTIGFCQISTVVAGLMKLLNDSNNHGGVLSVLHDLTYAYPEHLKDRETSS